MNSPVILITGAGKGIGKSVAEAVFQRKKQLGMPRLVLTSRTESELSLLQQQAQKEGLKCEILPMDLSHDPSRPVLLAVEKFGRLDQVIHGAGVGRFGDFLELTQDDLQYTMKTNVEATFLFMQAAYSQMKSQPVLDSEKYSKLNYKGDLLWITSVAAEKPFEQSSIYCMSKFAQRGLIEVLRLYGRKDGIRIIDVKPGATVTPMWGALSSETESRMMKPEDVAQVIVDTLMIHPRASVEEILIRPIAGDI
jgi:sepiapterin reductase